MNVFDALVLGIVEGLTEFLPVSSTAHLILAGDLLGLPSTDFLKSFDIAIQLGAILAVVTLYWRKFTDVSVLKNIAAGFIPTALLGLVLYRSVKGLLGDVSVVLWALLIGGIILIVFEYWHKSDRRSDLREMSIGQCALVGLCQAVAFIPGVSRSGATIVGGLSLGISRATIAEYSFLLAVPTMAAATLLDMLKGGGTLLSGDGVLALAVGFVTAYVTALLAIKFFISFVQKHDFRSFGVYRILIALVGFTYFI